jgi:hypothetical protein
MFVMAVRVEVIAYCTIGYIGKHCARNGSVSILSTLASLYNVKCDSRWIEIDRLTLETLHIPRLFIKLVTRSHALKE